jgi:hypothetical protein
VSEADLRKAIYVRPNGFGYHVVKNPCNDQTYVVGDMTGGQTATPGSVVTLASFTGNPGEAMIGRAPNGFGGASTYAVKTSVRAYDGATLQGDPPPPEPPIVAYGLYVSGTDYVSVSPAIRFSISVVKIYDTWAENALVGTVTVDLPSGYSITDSLRDGAFLPGLGGAYAFPSSDHTAMNVISLASAAITKIASEGTDSWYGNNHGTYGPMWSYAGSIYWTESTVLGDPDGTHNQRASLFRWSSGATATRICTTTKSCSAGGSLGLTSGAANAVFTDHIAFYYIGSVSKIEKMYLDGSVVETTYAAGIPACCRWSVPISPTLAYAMTSTSGGSFSLKTSKVTLSGGTYGKTQYGLNNTNDRLTSDAGASFAVLSAHNTTYHIASCYALSGNVFDVDPTFIFTFPSWAGQEMLVKLPFDI